MQNQFGKLLLSPEKPTSTSEIFLASEEMDSKSNLGRLFILLEIKSREQGLKEKIKELIDLIYHDYYSSPVPNPESALESTCQNVNLNLAEILPKPEIWYKKINFLVGALKDDFLVFSQMGEFSGFLIRQNKTSQILETKIKEWDKKFFSQITTGEVKPGDALIISTYPLFDFFSLEKIKKVITKLKMEQAMSQFKNLINENIRTPNLLTLFIKCEEEPLKINEKNGQMKKYLQELYGSEESMKQLENLEQRTKRTLAASLWPNLRKFRKTFSHIFKNKVAKKPAVEKRELKLPRLTKFGQWLKFWPTIKIWWGKIKIVKPLETTAATDKLSTFVPKIKKIDQKTKSKLIWLVMVVAFVFVGSLIFLNYQQKNRQRDETNQKTLNQVWDKKAETEAVLIYGDKQKAISLLGEARQLLKQIPQFNKKWQREISNANGEIEKIWRQINEIYEAESAGLVDLSNLPAIKQIIKHNNQLVFLDETGKTYQAATSTPQEWFALPGLTSLSSWDKDNLLLFDANNKFYLRGKDGTEKTLAISLPTGTKIDTATAYAEKIYYLSAGKIYKISEPLAATPASTIWFENINNPLPAISDLIIDGNIWLTEGNKIIKLYRGRDQNFQPGKLDNDLGNDLKIYTEVDWEIIYLVDKQNNRLILMDKNGAIKKQFLNDKLSQAENILISDQQDRLWFKTGNILYEVKLK